MNTKLFFACLLTAFGMLFWLIFQPTESMEFIGIRIAVAFCAAIMMLFAITWHKKKAWKKTAVVVLAVLGIGSVAHFAFNYGIVFYPRTTLVSMIVIVISCLLYIRFFEQKILQRAK